MAAREESGSPGRLRASLENLPQLLSLLHPAKVTPKLRAYVENLPRLLSLTHEEVSVLGRDGGDRGVTLDLMNPEDSPWLKEILNEVNSTDEARRMFAVWRFKETLQQFVRGGPERTKAVNVSIFLLTHGFAKELHRGFKDAVQTGRWYFVAKDYFEAMENPGEIDSGLFSRVSIYATAIEALIVDTRTLSFLLSEMPDLFQVLPSLFLKAQTVYPEEGRPPSPR